MREDSPYFQFVADYQRLVEDGKRLPVGATKPAGRPAIVSDAPRALLFSPHPDDECLAGALPLRLMCEQGIDVTDVAVTLGSSRQTDRHKELFDACNYLGYSVMTAMAKDWGAVKPETREREPTTWRMMTLDVSGILETLQPRCIFVPHTGDAHPTHVGTALLVADALHETSSDFSCLVFETEIWQPNPAANLMVGLDIQGVAELVTALTFHTGEVKRNPYHLALPAWMHDNVRRGSEVVGGWGSTAPRFTFASLYRAQKWAAGSMTSSFKGMIVAPEDSLEHLCSELPTTEVVGFLGPRFSRASCFLH